MDTRTVSSYSFVICIVLTVVIKSSALEKTTTLSSFSTVPTVKIPIIQSSESKVIRNIDKLPNESGNNFSAEDDVEGAPPDHIVPYSEHEDSEEPLTTRSKYTEPGGRSSFSPEIQLDFVPTKLYAQVRKSHTVKHLPRKDALKSATNEEEILDASRLREVVSKSKTNTIYTEEGYEDAAYDHGGHIRDADFHEDFDRKHGDQEDNPKNITDKKPEAERKGEIGSDDAEELNDYDDNYEDSSIIKASEILDKRDPKEIEKYKRLKNLWQDSAINPKQVTKNEIIKLEEDLEKEYEESERNTETRVPENLKNPREDDEEEENDSSSEADAARDRHYKEKVNEENNESSEASSEFLKNPSSMESEKNEIRDVSSPGPGEIEDIPVSVNSSADYGKIFWDYFKSVGDNRQPQEFFALKETETTLKNYDKSIAGELTSVPSFEIVQTTLADIDFNSPRTEFGDFGATSKTHNHYPSAASLYESWKRQDHYENSEESPETNSESLDSSTIKLEDIRDRQDSEKNQPFDLQNFDGSSTSISPKKLSYAVIIRPSEKPTTKSPPCDREDYTSPAERIPIVKSENTKLLNDLGNQASPEAINDFSFPNDFTIIRPPLAVPLRQVTYADFPPDSYASLTRPSVTQEIVKTGGEINNSKLDRYELLKNLYVNRGQNPHPRYIRFRGHKKIPHHPLPITKLVPPLPINWSKYSEYLGAKRVGKPAKRLDTSLSFDPWPGITQFYRSIDKKIFGRRRRSLDEENSDEENASSSDNGKIRNDSVYASGEKKFRPKRNLYRKPNRLVGDDNAEVEKSFGSGTRKRRSNVKLLHEAPGIVDEVINGEIESRFKEKDVDEDDDTEEDNGKGERIEIDVPDFNFSEVIENTEKPEVVGRFPIEEFSLDIEKYPFYENSKVPRSSPLKYITNPRKVPKKTLGGTEFYDSRDRYRNCAEVEPDLGSVLPEEEQPSEDQEPRGDQPRLRGLGDRLDCFRAKYFDDNPLDNPLFLEKQVGQPRIPEELDPAKFASRIFDEPNNEEEHRVVRRISRKPELTGTELRRSESKKNQFTHTEGKNYPSDLDDISSENLQRNHRNKIPENRARRKKRPQTTTKTPEVMVTPYQREVYEDVMGTIQNLAGLYQTFGEPISSSSIKPNLNHTPVTPREINVNLQTVHNMKRPPGLIFQGLQSPQATETPKFHRYRIIPYRTNKVSYRTRARTERPPGKEGVKVGYFRTVTVHKRSVDDEETLTDLKHAETKNIGQFRTQNATNDVTNLARSKKIKLDEKPAASESIVYTIHDRIRHSKPKGIFGKYGKFTNLDTSASEDMRRQEPRYNTIHRKKVSSSNDEPTTTVRLEESKNDPEEPVISTKNSTSKSKTSYGRDYHDEPNETYKIQYSTTNRRQVEPSNLERRDTNESSEEYEEDERTDEDETKKKKQKNNYDVHENLKDDVTTISSAVESTRGPEFFELSKYLQSDPPGYSKAFQDSEDEEGSKPYKIAEQRGEPKDDEEEEEEEEENEDDKRQVGRSLESYTDEESPKSKEDDDSHRQSESYKNPVVDEENKEKEELSDEGEEEEEEEEETHPRKVHDETISDEEDVEKEFERFASRPFSPFESYEDPKYTDLGPRLSKPSFHHPSFSSMNYRGKKFSKESENDESREGNEEKSRYVFPWEADKSGDEEDVEESNEKSHKIGRFEYPWEKRERLARERRRKKKEREKYERLYGFSDDAEDEEDDDASQTQSHGRHVYPWEYYKVPGRNSKRAKPTRWITDNVEMSSDYQPRFSSQYKTRNASMNDDDHGPIAESGADPRDSKISATKSINEASEHNSNKSSEILKNLLPLNTTTSDTTATSTSAPLTFTMTSKKPRKWNALMYMITTTPSTISRTGNNRKMRIWRTATSTTKKPIARRRKNGIENEESLVIDPARRTGLNSSVIDPSGSSLGITRINRRRGPLSNRSTISTTSTTRRPLRRRMPKTTPMPEKKITSHEESTMKSTTEKSTTPKVKTVEHRSRFSKEEIITKTSYPGLNNSNNSYNNREQNNNRGQNADPSDSKESLQSETIKKVSIMTKETPEHIYRTTEINKNGIKGMFVSVTPNNRTNSSLDTIQDFEDRLIDPEETRQMLKSFQNSEENDDAEDPEVSFVRNTHLLANLLRQVPPYINNLILDESLRRTDDFLGSEGRGSMDSDEDDDEDDTSIGIQTNYVKHPNHRLYYYVEDS